MRYELDATNQSLGRLSSKIASLLRGKNQPSYQPNIMPDVEISVKNLSKTKFTGKKFDNKEYHHYSGYHSGIKTRSLSELWARKPSEVLRKMVYNMLPQNKTRDKAIKNLKFEK